MNLEVKYYNGSILENRNYIMSRAAFIKHLGIAGQRYAPSTKKLIRTMGMFLHYSPFMKIHDFNNDHFSNPSPSFYDPTEKAHFSNLAGKAIADFLSKKIYKSKFTVNYEAAMKMYNKNFSFKIKRPDLIAFTSDNRTFAIESKGFTQSSSGNMHKHKKQSQSGPLPVDFSVASVSYNLYNKAMCNFYDPENEKVKYDENLVKSLTKEYYYGLNSFIQLTNIYNREHLDMEICGEKFYKIDLFKLCEFDEFCRFYKCLNRVFLILPLNIEEYAENGISKNVEPFLVKENEYEFGDDFYIDNDRIGILIERC